MDLTMDQTTSLVSFSTLMAKSRPLWPIHTAITHQCRPWPMDLSSTIPPSPLHLPHQAFQQLKMSLISSPAVLRSTRQSPLSQPHPLSQVHRMRSILEASHLQVPLDWRKRSPPWCLEFPCRTQNYPELMAFRCTLRLENECLFHNHHRQPHPTQWPGNPTNSSRHSHPRFVKPVNFANPRSSLP
jgi:hypothetical protein